MVKDDVAPHLGKAEALSSFEIEHYGFRLDGGEAAYAYWYPSNYLAGDYEGAITLHCAALGEPRLYDMLDGTIYEIPESMITRDAFGGMVLSLLPVRDYPLVVVFE